GGGARVHALRSRRLRHSTHAGASGRGNRPRRPVNARYSCGDEPRRHDVSAHATLNGIDFLEVLDDPAMPDEKRQRKLFVNFVKPLAPNGLKLGQVRIDGGVRIRNVLVSAITIGSGDANHVLTVEVDRAGDFSTYTLRLVRSSDDSDPPDGFDVVLAAVEFSFKASCPSPFDCRPGDVCAPEPVPAPVIDYLAKDYSSFRRLMLDRLAASMPSWIERSPADLGVALVEALAYVGDHLSYQQDAIATEAYLGTARRRISARRHARLVDYFMHDGCNARAWIHVHVTGDVVTPTHTLFLTRVDGQPARVPPATLDRALLERPLVFEAMHDAALFAAHNDMPFWTWGDRECCLPRGATSATLGGDYPHLAAGDVLIFEEIRGPRTGRVEDADPEHRHAVR